MREENENKKLQNEKKERGRRMKRKVAEKVRQASASET